MTRRFVVAAALALAACHSAHDAPATVSADQERQLNDAAAALDANAVTANVQGGAR